MNPLIAMGAIARTAGMYQLRRERVEMLRQVETLRLTIESERKQLAAVAKPRPKSKKKSSKSKEPTT